ncbi:hypothetical protein [Trueperella sp. LYQ141]|uniref:hypothetical protein n=1 Tax=Trueperella sp. LYQ141 TaxID=3391058 RepID=UPI003983BF49
MGAFQSGEDNAEEGFAFEPSSHNASQVSAALPVSEEERRVAEEQRIAQEQLRAQKRKILLFGLIAGIILMILGYFAGSHVRSMKDNSNSSAPYSEVSAVRAADGDQLCDITVGHICEPTLEASHSDNQSFCSGAVLWSEIPVQLASVMG